MDVLSLIRRWHFREKMPIREISRHTRLSRNTITMYLASGEVEPKYPPRNPYVHKDCEPVALQDGEHFQEATPAQARVCTLHALHGGHAQYDVLVRLPAP